MPRGGKRQRAGRPPGHVPANRVHYRLDERATRMLREFAAAHELTPDAALRLAVTRVWQDWRQEEAVSAAATPPEEGGQDAPTMPDAPTVPDAPHGQHAHRQG